MLSSQARRQFPVSLAILVMCGGLGFGLSKLTNTPAEEGKIVSVPLVESRILQPESVQFTIKSQGVVRPALKRLWCLRCLVLLLRFPPHL